jgi:cytochrome b pre-mRNA-processing protein 3
MFGRLFRRDPEADAIAAALYGAIVAQARNPALYAGFGVADTVSGRFEMVILHLFLVLDRLQTGDARDAVIAQRLFDLHATDMDQSLREMGIGDLGVPKRMKKMTESFYGRSAVYRPLIAGSDKAGLADAVARNVFPEGAAAGAADGLATYMIAAAEVLRAAPATAPRFPDPAAHVPAAATA